MEAAGWKFGTAADFLGMTPEEEAYGDPSVSVDLLVRGLFALGATRRELARAV